MVPRTLRLIKYGDVLIRRLDNVPQRRVSKVVDVLDERPSRSGRHFSSYSLPYPDEAAPLVLN
jgi:hypothetical protein